MKTLLSVFVFFSFFSIQAQNSQDTLSIYFDFNKSELSEANAELIMEFNSSDHGDIKQVIAHCDTVGSKAYNLDLANKRGESVIAKLNSAVTQTISEGENISSKAINYDPEIFRRVDIIYNTSNAPLTLTEKFTNFKVDSIIKKTNIDLTILFYPGSPELREASYAEVHELYNIMKNNPNFKVHIHGHVCCGANYVLSKNRAHAVYMYLLQKRIAPNRLRYTGHSNNIPKVWPETTAEDKDANRRVSVEFARI